MSPAAAEGRAAAIAVLQAVKPMAGEIQSFFRSVIAPQRFEGQDSSRGVVAVRDAAGEVSPGPTAGGGAGVGVSRLVLLVQEPRTQFVVLIQTIEFAGGRQCVDAERGDPGGKVAVDGPAAVGANRIREELDGLAGDGVIG